MLAPGPYVLAPDPYVLAPDPDTLAPGSCALAPGPYTLDPDPYIYSVIARTVGGRQLVYFLNIITKVTGQAALCSLCNSRLERRQSGRPEAGGAAIAAAFTIWNSILYTHLAYSL